MAIYDIFIGTYTKGKDNGLFRCSFDNDSGEINLINTIDIESPSYLQLNNNILYGVSELSSFNGENGGALFAVYITAPEKMHLLDIKGTHGRHPCHLYIKDNYVFVSNYSEGSLSIFETDVTGHLLPSTLSLHHFGKGTRPDRQEASHIHFAAVTPDDKYLALCDLGMDKVFLYPYSTKNGLSINAKEINCPPGSGPRHLTFSTCGNYIYVLTELSNTILSYRYNEGNIQLIQEISTLPADYKGSSSVAAIHLSPNGLYVAASNRGHNSIAIFSITDDGRLVYANHVKTGKDPRDFRFSPCGKWLLSANQNDDSVTIFHIENNTFIQKGIFNIPKPVCILFGRCAKDELSETATCAKIAQVQTEGKREVSRDIAFYNLDMIIAVGYRVNSKQEEICTLKKNKPFMRQTKLNYGQNMPENGLLLPVIKFLVFMILIGKLCKKHQKPCLAVRLWLNISL